jgi:RNA polymerase sigma factor (sigma-70 family)
MDERHQTPWAERVLVERLSGGDETGFLGTLTHRRAVDAVRREEARRRRESRVARETGDVPDVATAVLRSDTTGRVRTALDVLPEAQRRALELAYFQGYTYRQVADVLGIPEGTAKSRLRLALARIAESLGSETSEESERWV